MAGETFSTITTALSQIYSARLADQRNMSADELNYIPIVQNDSGKNIAWVARFTGTKATSVFAEGSAVTAGEFTKSVKVPAVLNFGNYRSPAQVSDLAAILAAGAEGSPQELRDLVGVEIDDSLMQITKSIATDVYVGAGTSGGNPNIVGLGIAAGLTGTYATIARGTYSEWAGSFIGNGGVLRPLTDDLMRTAEVAVFNAGGRPPNLILTTGNIHRKYAGLFTPNVRVVTNGSPAPQLASLGTNELYWSNCPVVRSSRAPANKLFMFNTANVELVIPRGLETISSVPMNPFVKRMGLDLRQKYMLPIVVAPLANNGNSLDYNVFCYVQLRVKRPNEVATIDDISET